jgi:hypothetical protein
MVDANLGSGARPIPIEPEDHQDFVELFQPSAGG